MSNVQTDPELEVSIKKLFQTSGLAAGVATAAYSLPDDDTSAIITLIGIVTSGVTTVSIYWDADGNATTVDELVYEFTTGTGSNRDTMAGGGNIELGLEDSAGTISVKDSAGSLATVFGFGREIKRNT